MEKRKLNISCDTITMDVFIDCCVHGHLWKLDGTATEEELQEAWNVLSEEYAQKSGNVKHKYMLELIKRTAILENKIQLGTMAAQLGNDTGREVLIKLGYAGNAEALLKRDIITLKTCQAELDKAQNNEGTEKLTRTDFIRWITVVSKYIGYRIDIKVVTVTEFLEMERLMKMANKSD